MPQLRNQRLKDLLERYPSTHEKLSDDQKDKVINRDINGKKFFIWFGGIYL
jgi:hypothetical protein